MFLKNTVKEIALERLEIGTAGFRVRETVGFRGVKRWQVEGFAESFGFTNTDLFSIYMWRSAYKGRQFLEPLAGTPFWDDRRSDRGCGRLIGVADCLSV